MMLDMDSAVHTAVQLDSNCWVEQFTRRVPRASLVAIRDVTAAAMCASTDFEAHVSP